MSLEEPQFNSAEEEAKYWKKLATEYKASYTETKEELDEYQVSSQELEAELEAQLEQADARCNDLRQQVNRLAFENQNYKEKLDKEQNEYCKQLSNLQDELTGIKSNKESLVKYIRELEQTNDDLERAKRTTLASLEDFEAKLNSAIERNAFLESELDEKESLKVMVQRLKDEARDLRQEVNVKKKDPLPDNDVAMREQQMNGETQIIDSNKYVTDLNGDLKSNKCYNMHTTNGNVNPTARVNALNIVGDLLRKVGALETRVASCRTHVKENRRPITLPTSGNHSAR